jgi:hypothetical protein
MNKTIIAVLTAFALIFSLAGCTTTPDGKKAIKGPITGNTYELDFISDDDRKIILKVGMRLASVKVKEVRPHIDELDNIIDQSFELYDSPEQRFIYIASETTNVIKDQALQDLVTDRFAYLFEQEPTDEEIQSMREEFEAISPAPADESMGNQ